MTMNFFISCILNTFLNIYPLFLIDIFYDNQTYIGNSLGHPYYLFLWTCTTLYGMYFFSPKIWKEYSTKVHYISFALLFIGGLLPYQQEFFLFKNLHVWFITVGLCLYGYQWLHFIYKRNNYYHLLILLLMCCVFSIFFLGHVTSFCEILFSVGINWILYFWQRKNR